VCFGVSFVWCSWDGAAPPRHPAKSPFFSPFPPWSPPRFIFFPSPAPLWTLKTSQTMFCGPCHPSPSGATRSTPQLRGVLSNETSPSPLTVSHPLGSTRRSSVPDFLVFPLAQALLPLFLKRLSLLHRDGHVPSFPLHPCLGRESSYPSNTRSWAM